MMIQKIFHTDTQTENEEEINSYKEKIGLYNYGILFLKKH